VRPEPPPTEPARGDARDGAAAGLKHRADGGPGPEASRRRYHIPLRGVDVELGGRTLVMGVLNVTPDSFSDGGRFRDEESAIAAGLALFADGADWVDVGGESTRPGGAERVSADVERARVVPVIEGLRRRGAGILSIDTTRAEVARAALDAGADLVNDVSGLRFDPSMAGLVAERKVPSVLMHLRGDFATMHRAPAYADVMAEVGAELAESLRRGERAGIARETMIVDPGIGFAKSAVHSLEVLRRLPELDALDRPVLVGPSRKSFIGNVLDAQVGERLFGTAAAVAAAVLGGAHVVRVHDVREMAQVVRVADAIRGGI
jgi:dihydropteroate synthase